MNYEEMSDFEINKAVSIALGHAYDGRGYVDGADGVYHVAIQYGRRVELPDYCNNPSDAWPIIHDNHINMVWGGDDEWHARTVHTMRIYHKNPLRAAMIVFLMMQEAK